MASYNGREERDAARREIEADIAGSKPSFYGAPLLKRCATPQCTAKLAFSAPGGVASELCRSCALRAPPPAAPYQASPQQYSTGSIDMGSMHGRSDDAGIGGARLLDQVAPQSKRGGASLATRMAAGRSRSDGQAANLQSLLQAPQSSATPGHNTPPRDKYLKWNPGLASLGEFGPVGSSNGGSESPAGSFDGGSLSSAVKSYGAGGGQRMGSSLDGGSVYGGGFVSPMAGGAFDSAARLASSSSGGGGAAGQPPRRGAPMASRLAGGRAKSDTSDLRGLLSDPSHATRPHVLVDLSDLRRPVVRRTAGSKPADAAGAPPGAAADHRGPSSRSADYSGGPSPPNMASEASSGPRGFAALVQQQAPHVSASFDHGSSSHVLSVTSSPPRSSPPRSSSSSSSSLAMSWRGGATTAELLALQERRGRASARSRWGASMRSVSPAPSSSSSAWASASERGPSSARGSSLPPSRGAASASPLTQSTTLLEATLSALAVASGSVASSGGRAKHLTVVRWLAKVACNGDSAAGFDSAEARFNDVMKVARALGLHEMTQGKHSAFAGTGPLTPAARASLRLPGFITALDTAHGCFFAQAFSGGASAFYCNGGMGAMFLSAAEAEAEHAAAGHHPDAVLLRRLVVARDRPPFLRCLADLLVCQPATSGQASVDLHVAGRTGPVLCRCDLRAHFATDGDFVVLGAQLTPLSGPSASALNGLGGGDNFGNLRGGGGGGGGADASASFSDHLDRARGFAVSVAGGRADEWGQPLRPVVKRGASATSAGTQSPRPLGSSAPASDGGSSRQLSPMVRGTSVRVSDKDCATPRCTSSRLLVQASGFCTACTQEAVKKAQAAAAKQAWEAAAPEPPGSLFGGRLTFHFVPLTPAKQKALFDRREEKPTKAIVDYKYMCVKHLLKQAQRAGVGVLELFNFFDSSGDGEVDGAEFAQALGRLGVFGTSREIKGVMALFNDDENPSTISLREFMDTLGREGLPVLKAKVAEVVVAKPVVHEETEFSEDKLTDWLHKIHAEITRQALLKKGGRETKGPAKPNFEPIFKRFDATGEGEIDLIELASGLKSFGFRLNKPQLRQVLGVFDPKNNGTIDSKEFFRFCQCTDVGEAVRLALMMQAEAKRSMKFAEHEIYDMVGNIHEKLVKLAKSLSPDGAAPDYRKMFQSMDLDGGGQLTMDEFIDGLKGMGFEMNSKRSKQIKRVFDSDKSGEVDYDEFVAFCEAPDTKEAVRVTLDGLADKKAKKKEKKRKAFFAAGAAPVAP